MEQLLEAAQRTVWLAVHINVPQTERSDRCQPGFMAFSAKDAVCRLAQRLVDGGVFQTVDPSDYLLMEYWRTAPDVLNARGAEALERTDTPPQKIDPNTFWKILNDYLQKLRS